MVYTDDGHDWFGVQIEYKSSAAIFSQELSNNMEIDNL